MQGKIVKGIAGFYYVNVVESGIYECKAKGIFRKDKMKPLVGDDVEIDFDSGVITNHTKGTSFQGQAFPEFMQKIIAAEGLINYINNK